MRHVIAGPFWRLALGSLGGYAITMPWSTAYYLPDQFTRENIEHEEEHGRQIAADGAIMFSIRYLYWTARHGYWWNPYEVAARIRCGEQEDAQHYRAHPTLKRLLDL